VTTATNYYDAEAADRMKRLAPTHAGLSTAGHPNTVGGVNQLVALLADLPTD
jgi:hypothetical protein